MKYRLTVEIIEPPTEADEMMRSIYGRIPDSPERLARALSVELTETEWRAVKKAVIETM